MYRFCTQCDKWYPLRLMLNYKKDGTRVPPMAKEACGDSVDWSEEIQQPEEKIQIINKLVIFEKKYCAECVECKGCPSFRHCEVCCHMCRTRTKPKEKKS